MYPQSLVKTCTASLVINALKVVVLAGILEFEVNHLFNLLVLNNPHGVIYCIINISILIRLFPIQIFEITTHLIHFNNIYPDWGLI